MRPATTSPSSPEPRTTSPATFASRSSSSDAKGRVVTLPTARVLVADGLDAPPFLETKAKLERIGVPGGDEADATHIYVADLKLPRAGHVLDARRAGGRQRRRCRRSGTSSS